MIATNRPVRQRLHLADVRLRRGRELHPGVRSDPELSVGERAVDGVRDALGSWPFLALAVALVGAGIGAALAHDGGAGPAAALGLILGGIAVVQLLLVLMAARRAHRTAAEQERNELESIRRAAAGIDDVRNEVVQVREDLARLIARLDIQRETTR